MNALVKVYMVKDLEGVIHSQTVQSSSDMVSFIDCKSNKIRRVSFCDKASKLLDWCNANLFEMRVYSEELNVKELWYKITKDL